jgi:hypothetical protein
MANGLANRFLWAKVKQAKSLPFGGEWYTVGVSPVTAALHSALRTFGGKDLRLDFADGDARELWVEAYGVLTEDRPGMFGAITARAEAQTLRLALLYAVAGGSNTIQTAHIESALAVWGYCEDSAGSIFGNATGNPDADKVLEHLRDGELTRDEIRDIFSRNWSSDEIDRIKDFLLDAERITVTRERRDAKKPTEVWRAS